MGLRSQRRRNSLFVAMRNPKFKKRVHLPDAKYSEPKVTRFVSNLMLRGKRSLAQAIFDDAIALVEKKIPDRKGIEVWLEALENVSPSVEAKGRRMGGSNFQVPVLVPPNRKVSLGMKWMIRAARDRKGRRMSERLAQEIIAAHSGEGHAMRRKENARKMAEANRAFSHLRF